MFIKTFKVQNFINGVLSVKFSSTGLLQDCVVDQGLVDRALELAASDTKTKCLPFFL